MPANNPQPVIRERRLLAPSTPTTCDRCHKPIPARLIVEVTLTDKRVEIACPDCQET